MKRINSYWLSEIAPKFDNDSEAPQGLNKIRRNLIRKIGKLGTLIAAQGLSLSAIAQSNFPNKPIKVVVGSAPGGIDTIMRLIGPALQDISGQPYVIENKVGANGIVGVQAVMSSPPDGYTILFTTISTMTINPFVYANLPYHPLRDLEPIALHASLPMVWAAYPETGFKSLKDVVDYARINPGLLNVANPGNGSFGHLIEEAFRKKHNIDITLVPFKTTVQAMTETLTGRVHICVDNLSNLKPHFDQRRLTALALTSRQRSVVVPNVPTWFEDQTGDFEAVAWYAFMAPKGTPVSVLHKLNKDITSAIQAPAAEKYLTSTGAQFFPRSPEKVREFIQSELDKFGAIAKAANISLQ